MLTFHLCLTQKSSARQHKTHGWGKEYMLKQVYSLLASCTACKVQAKCCVFLFINLICNDMSDYVGKNNWGGEGEKYRDASLSGSSLTCRVMNSYSTVLYC